MTTIITTSDVKQEAATVPVRVVDCDVHPYPRRGDLQEFLDPKIARHLRLKGEGANNGVFYDAPDFYHANAMRVDSFPDDGEFACSDPALAFQQLVLDSGSDLVILGPTSGGGGDTDEETTALAAATNAWQEARWLDSENNWHGRFYGSICANISDPERAALEIEAWAGHERFKQILIHAEPRPSWGHPKYDPIWAAAVKHNIPIACHLGRGQHNLLPMSPVGFMTYNHDFMVTYSMLAANQVMSLIFDGVFERFPTLQFLFIEHAFSWILPLMWRMDAIHAARGNETGLSKEPSQYVKDNIWFTTQPLDYPDDKLELVRALEWMEADKLLLFSSDYPHWTFDEPRWLAKHLPERMREPVMFGNATKLFGLPTEVAPLPGQVRAF
ncbi:putative TIM-barrel fold metal-dependent hydrolase [Microbacterium terrae]|uniref:Amidohydrolase n=1 Tax=Microbacterium terrae TaxID=69369 RepID=A0A0M2HBX9_9MICO|nr:amidohydrolase family protein [Microbacterium terrae]KJL44017.1 Amidohydrolase [Microbacterium terrae]MBP1079449.1 putative TIM-barrel fold metal-dependent hydrolase [Microbacterium terrae]GLJ98850.1 amidohydrolase [Microbacterium terrae]